MQLTDTGIKFKSVGGQGAISYKIAQNSKIADMLANMLYKNKERAPIRELATNAWDAHIMAGTTHLVPEVKLPTANDLTFKIRDFGTGLSREDMENLYLTIGESNKDHSNEFNGCMGIGSKSPFAYTRSFITVSYYNGMRYVGVNAKNALNMPGFEIHSEEPTTEPNGLEVSFVVKPFDVHKFTNEAQSVLKWLPVEFKVTPPLPKQVEQKPLIEGKDWKLFGSGRSVAIMGWVEYPIEASMLHNNSSDEEQESSKPAVPAGVDKENWYQHYYTNDTVIAKLLGLGVRIHFNIGEVEMDISREGLQYTPKTVNAIKQKLTDIHNEITEKVTKEHQSAKTLWEASVIYYKYLHTLNLKNLESVLQPKWNGKTITSHFSIYGVKDFEDGGADLWRFSSRGYSNRAYRDHTTNINVGENTRFIINDQEKGAHAAVYRLHDSNGAQGTKLTVYLAKFKSDAHRLKFNELIGIDDSFWTYSSTLPKPPKKVGGPRQKRDNVFKFNAAYYGSDGKSHWTPDRIDFKTGGYYIEINNWSAYTEKGRQLYAHKLKDIINSMKRLNIVVPDFFGIKTASIKRYQKSHKWTDIYDWIVVAAENYINTNKVAVDLFDLKSFSKHEGAINFYRNLNTRLNKFQLSSNSKLLPLVDKCNYLNTLRQNKKVSLETINSISATLNLTINASGKDDLEQLVQDVEKQYPFLKLYKNIGYLADTHYNDMVESVKMFNSIL